MRRYLPEMMLIYSATLWGLVWLPIRWLGDAGFSGLWQSVISYLAAMLVVMPFFLRTFQFRQYQRQGDLGNLYMLALASGWCNVAFVMAMLEGEVLRVLLFFYLSPVWAFILGHFMLNEKMTGRVVLLLLVAMSGALLMLLRDDFTIHNLGSRADWLALSSGFTFAVGNIYVRKMQVVRLLDKVVFTWAGVIIVGTTGILYFQQGFPVVQNEYWAGAILLGIAGFLSMTLAVQYGVTHMPVQRSAVILLFELVVGGVSAAWLAGEHIEFQELAGGLLIVAASFASVRFVRSNSGEHE